MALVKLGMNEKDHLLALIRKAKSSHIRWRAYAQGLVAGVKVQEDRLPISHTDCKFGHWYYGEGRSQLGDLNIFEDIEGPHEMLHAIYGQIFELVQNGKSEKAHRKLDEMVSVSRSLLEQIELLEAEVDARYAVADGS